MRQGLQLVAGGGCVDGVDGDTISLAPPFIIEPDQIRKLTEILRTAIDAVGAAVLAAG
jgi:adenosylmethionine-8-amino-7-oxononanoate aminotransferase